MVTVGYGTIQEDVTSSGSIEPASQADLDFAVSGQVTAVDVGVGDKVAAGQLLATISPVSLQASVDSAQATLDTDQARLVSDQSAGATAAVAVSQLPSVRTGDPAAVTPAGWSHALEGRVTGIAVLPVTPSGSSSPTVDASVSVPDVTGLFSGAQASVQITLGAIADTMAVPTSAVHTLGTRHFVDVASKDSERAQSVTVGYVGSAYTQVTAGLRRGDRVVLADPSTPIPSGTPTLGAAARLAGLGGGGGVFRRTGRG